PTGDPFAIGRCCMRITERNEQSVTTRSRFAHIADSLLLGALDPCGRVEWLSAGSVAGAAPAVGRGRAAVVSERDRVPVRRGRTGTGLRGTGVPGQGVGRRRSCPVPARGACREDGRCCSG